MMKLTRVSPLNFVHFRRFLAGLFAMLFAVSAQGAYALATGQTFTDAETFLVWSAVGGGAGVLASLIVDRLAWFATRTAEFKFVATVLIAGTLAVLARLGLDFIPPSVLDVIDRYAGVFIGAVSPFLGMHAAHSIKRGVRKLRGGVA